MVYPCCGRVLHPVAVGILSCRIGRVLCCCRVEEHLRVEYVMCHGRRTEHPEVARQPTAESLLCHVDLGHHVAVVVHTDDGVVVHQSERGAVVLRLRATAECQVMLLHASRACDDLMEVRIEAPVIIVQSPRLGRSPILCRTEHRQVFVHRLHAIVSVIRNLESASSAAFGLHFDDTRGTSRTIPCRLRSIFQNREARNVRRIDSRQRRHVRGHPVNNHQRVVATGDRGRTAHPHTVEHSHTVSTVGRHVHTGRLSAECLQRIVYKTFPDFLMADMFRQSVRGHRICHLLGILHLSGKLQMAATEQHYTES